VNVNYKKQETHQHADEIGERYTEIPITAWTTP